MSNTNTNINNNINNTNNINNNDNKKSKCFKYFNYKIKIVFLSHFFVCGLFTITNYIKKL